MSSFTRKGIGATFFAFFPVVFVFLGGWALPIAGASWYISYRLFLALLKEERRAAKRATRRL